MNTITFLIVLSILVFIHELGHFSIARLFGVKVYDFSIGFGKKIFTKYYKGTNWSISLIPLGGYVKMKGQEDLNPNLVNTDKDSYQVLSPIQRIAILFAGPFANFILATFLFFIIALLGVNAISPTIGETIDDLPAKTSGLKVGDTIVKINNTDIKIWSQISNVIQKSETIIRFYVKRKDGIHQIQVTPKIHKSKNMFGETIYKKMVGIAPQRKIIVVKYNIANAVVFALNKTYESSKMIFLGIQKMIEGIIPTNQIGGVITIGKVIGDASENGIVALLSIMALISVNLGVLNLLPIPALDGGHIMFNLYELIFKRKPNTKVLIQLTIIGWVILVSLMVFGLYNDINRFF